MDSLHPAFVLHSRDYRDTSLLIEFFTPVHGRVSAVARGARSVRHGASQRAILQPFQPLLIDFAGRTELKTVRAVEVRAPALILRGPVLFSALYLNELLCRLLPRDDINPELFADYETTLQQLGQSDLLDVLLRRFELSLLDALGYGFDLAHSDDRAIQAERFYQFDPQRGLVAARAQPQAVSGRDILDYLAGDYSVGARRALKLLCRHALRPHLGEQPLRSRQLFRGNN
jgi:DNA repair protein RecO (recombination protein O)